ncbi:hypothetical protein KFK09_019586 [Dendrobium nobile]|uniref:Reverse transcriptase domain-containing protein n=1 Tax=Dendrobium nobile TaxID=94219 RepID=A0A8T3ARE0_DENNO|nr:hypothetical protein KFK09_019580 [Dendrobium nobile]KAI0498696.1 hypothetical protein KFK09_019586 [Dendrobium nobile]
MEGDNNTKYFHSLVNKKRPINSIHKIARDNDSVTEDKDEIATMAVNFFHSHLNKVFNTVTNVNPSIIPNVITCEDNCNLSMVPLLEEVKGILFNMNVDSVAGPDGYTTKLFQSTWSIIASDVFQAVKNFFNGSPIPKFFTSTTVVLIPKNPVVNSWNDFRPISLCNVFYKLISKLLANRLSILLPKIISPFQMGFVKGRSIADNILLAQELCQDLDIKVRGGNMVMKLDIAKAYDNINWSFLYKILSLFGFDSNFINLINACIESPFYSIIVNGKTHGYFQASHGLRQGDPLSPSMFIITADYLSRGLANLFFNCPSLYFKTLGGFQISHLCFADDFIVFSNASKNSIGKFLEFLIILKM